MPSRAVLTVAACKPIYFDLAIQLARSFEYWNSDNDIRFFILTDLDEPIPRGLRKTHKIAVAKGSLGKGFSVKLQLDRFLPAEATLFIDADCLCLAPLDFVFDRFSGHSVSVVGGIIADGEWGGDVAATCTAVGVASLPKFNGGIYYVA